MTNLYRLACASVLGVAFALAPLTSYAATPTVSPEILALQLRILELRLELAALVKDTGAARPPFATDAKPTCTLTADDEYPGDPGKKVELSWTSENAEYATLKYQYANSERWRVVGGRLLAEGSKRVGSIVSTTYLLTVQGYGGSATCDIIINYKG